MYLLACSTLGILVWSCCLPDVSGVQCGVKTNCRHLNPPLTTEQAVQVARRFFTRRAQMGSQLSLACACVLPQKIGWCMGTAMWQPWIARVPRNSFHLNGANSLFLTTFTSWRAYQSLQFSYGMPSHLMLHYFMAPIIHGTLEYPTLFMACKRFPGLIPCGTGNTGMSWLFHLHRNRGTFVAAKQLHVKMGFTCCIRVDLDTHSD